MNVIDSLAGDSKFIETRSKQPQFSTLKAVEAEIAQVGIDMDNKAKEASDAFDKEREKAKEELK